MRIISGKFGGRRFMPPGKIPARPTTDKAKEALFNIIGGRYDLPDTVVLDLFAGTGNISFEFLSRGCSNVVAVERNFASVQFIRQTVETIAAPGRQAIRDRKSVVKGTSVSVRVDLGGRRIRKKNN